MSIAQNKSQNIARPISLRSVIDNLPSFSTVHVGETSGNIPYVKQTRKNLLNDMKNGVYDYHAPSFIFALQPNYWQLVRSSSSHVSAITTIEERLEHTIQNCHRFGKFIAYSPYIDLQAGLSSNDAPERLERTRNGLLKTRQDLLDSTLPHADQIIKSLDSLIDQIAGLNDDTKSAWSEKINSVQQQVLDDMTIQDIQHSDYDIILTGAANTYQ